MGWSKGDRDDDQDPHANHKNFLDQDKWDRMVEMVLQWAFQ